jgi:tetratricopeptide (TPR) repeat protein
MRNVALVCLALLMARPAFALRRNPSAEQARAAFQAGRLDAALTLASQAVKAEPRRPDLYVLRAAVENRLKLFEDAEQDADRALELQPNNGLAFDERAVSKLNRGRFEGASKDAGRAIVINSKDAFAWMAEGLAREGEGDVAGAKLAFERAVKLKPGLKGRLERFKDRHADVLDMLPDDSPNRLWAASAAIGAAASLLGFAFWRKRTIRAPQAGSDAPKDSVGQLLSIYKSLQPFESARYAKPKAPEPEPRGQVDSSRAAAPSAMETLTPPPSPETAPAAEASVTIGSSPPAAGSTAAVGGPSKAPKIGGNYELGRELGRGGMGVVYEAYDIALGRKVALKEIRAELSQSARDRDRFLLEARTVAKFQHNNIIGIHSIVEEGGRTYLVFEHVDGESLAKILDRNRKLAPVSALPIIKAIGEALDYAHSRKVIHRDLKPANIMVTNEDVVKVMDFGIAHEAKLALSRLTNAEAFGTMAYMPPEQEMGRSAKESDVFAFAVLSYEVLVGRLPFPGPNYSAQKQAKAYQKPSEADRSLPAEIDPAFELALDPDPLKRPSSAGEFAAAVEAAFSRS